MKKVISLITLALLQIGCFAVNVETTTNLNVYYPDYTKIDLICGQMPKAAQKITGTVPLIIFQQKLW